MAKNTRERILKTAVELFAEQGLDSTPLRQITQDADVNLAAVNYHFGSKEGLIRAVFEQRVSAINRNRLTLLGKYTQDISRDDPLDLDRLLECFINPVFNLSDGDSPTDPLFLRLIGRLYTDPAEPMREIFMREFGLVLERYQHAIVRAIPAATDAEAIWAINFMVGTISHALLMSETLCTFTNGACNPDDLDAMRVRLIRFCGAGIRATCQPTS